MGAVLIAAFGAMKEPAHTLDQLLYLLGRRPFILWMVGQAVLVLAIIVGAKLLRIMNPRGVNNPRTRLLRGMAYGGVSGILSAHSLLVAKSAVELLVRTIVDRVNQFNRWQSWATLLGLLALALSQLYYLHRGLKLVSTSILYPFVFCIYNIIAILDGLIYFRQTSKLSVAHALLVSRQNPSTARLSRKTSGLFDGKIALGTVILLAGVFALSWRLNDSEATPTPVGQGALAPGLGFVDETTEEEEPMSSMTDEETFGVEPSGGASPPSPILVATAARRRGMTEAAEIWGELEDAGGASRFSSPAQRRRSSLPASSSLHGLNGDQPSETTALLRSSTGRSQRDRRRRSGLFARRESGSSRGKGAGSQDTLGGWWPLRWWKRRRRHGQGTAVASGDETLRDEDGNDRL